MIKAESQVLRSFLIKKWH